MAGSTALKNLGGFGGMSHSITSLVFGSSDTVCTRSTAFETKGAGADRMRLVPKFPISRVVSMGRRNTQLEPNLRRKQRLKSVARVRSAEHCSG
jgi:hypothetical protein